VERSQHDPALSAEERELIGGKPSLSCAPWIRSIDLYARRSELEAIAIRMRRRAPRGYADERADWDQRGRAGGHADTDVSNLLVVTLLV